MSKDKITALVLPVYNEAKVIESVLEKIKSEFSHVVCVDDGSTDLSAQKIVDLDSVYLIQHLFNMGQGAALQTGIEFALMLPNIKYIVTVDSDGQHRISDVTKLVNRLKSNQALDIVLGSRFLDRKTKLKRGKRFILKTAIFMTNITTGLKLTDVHNGLRAMTAQTARKIKITQSGMAHASEILTIIKNKKLKYEEVPVTIDYTEYSLAKGQSVLNSLNIVAELLFRERG